jgi:hypothetical protein
LEFENTDDVPCPLTLKKALEMQVDITEIVLAVLGLVLGALVGYVIGKAAGMMKARDEIIRRVKELVIRGKIDLDLEDVLRRKIPKTKHQ